MKTIKSSIILLGLSYAIVLISGCKKDTLDEESSFFIEGRGLRKIHEVNHPSAGNFSGFKSSTMMLSGETLDWVFAWFSSANNAYGYQPYRRRINITTGDTLANPGVPAGNPVEWLVSPDNYYRYANATNKLCWLSGSSLEGEAQGLPLPYYVSAKVYDYGQLFSYDPNSAYNGFSGGMHTKPVSAIFYKNGLMVDTNYLLSNNVGLEMIRCMDMDMNPAGEILMFLATGDSIQVRRFGDNTIIAAVPCTALSADYTDYSTSPYCYLNTRRSADGSTITGYINNNRVNPAQSTTFVYNTSSNTIEIKLNALPVNVYPNPIYQLSVFDDAGNVYYVNEPSFIAGEAYGGITKQTPAGNTVLADRFLRVSTATVQRLFAVGNKLFALLHVGENTNAASGSVNTTYVLTVAEN